MKHTRTVTLQILTYSPPMTIISKHATSTAQTLISKVNWYELVQSCEDVMRRT